MSSVPLKRQTLRQTVSRFRSANDGTTGIEYSVLSGGIALAVLLVVGAVGQGTLAKFQVVLAAVLH